jgi:hypothetical protein
LNKSHSLISRLCALVALILAFCYGLGRVGFEHQTLDIVKALGLSWCVLFLPALISGFFVGKRGPGAFGDECLLTIGLLAVLTFAGWISTNGIYLLYFLLPLGVLLFFCQFARTLRTPERESRWSWLAAVLLGSGIAATCWNGRHLSPLFFEMLSSGEFSGTADFGKGIDTLFHLSIAQMIKTYGVATIGIDGLIPIKYHYGSHFVLAQFSRLMDMHPLLTYQISYPVIFYPVFIKIFLLTSLQVRKCLDLDFSTFSPPSWVVLLVLIFGYVPYMLLNKVGLNLETVWVSESYLFSLIVLFCLISVSIGFWEQATAKGQPRMLPVTLLYALTLLILFTIIGFFKASTMAVLLAVVAYMFLRLKVYRNFLLGTWTLLTALIFTLVVFQVTSIRQTPSQTFFYSISQFVSVHWLLFIPGYYLLTGVTIGFFLAVLATSTQGLKERFFKNKLLLAEILCISSLAGFGSLTIFGMEGGSSFYFSEVQYWMAASLLLALMPQIEYYLKFRFRSHSAILVGKAILVLLFFVVALNVSTRWFVSLYSNYHTRKQIIYYQNGVIPFIDNYTLAKKLTTLSGSKLIQLGKVFTAPAQDSLNLIPMYRTLRSIRELDLLENKNSTVAFVNNYLRFIDGFPCYKYPFLIPSLAGIATWQGWDKEACYWIGNYGFEDYEKRNRSFYNASIDSLCQDIRGTRFSQILLYDLNNNGHSIRACR